MKSIYFPFSISHFHFNGWKWAVVLLGLFFARAALAADSLYENDAMLDYTCPPDPIPTIDATNFVNNSSFTINFTSYSVNTEFYEPWDTVNYTNNGVMTINTGFKFDTLSSSNGFHSMAGNFYNSGTIRCGSLLDADVSFFFGYGQFIASATNLVVPGTIDVGPDDFIRLTGQNADLSRSVLMIENGGGGVTGTGTFGLNTNYWDPSIYLAPTYAESAFFPIAPYYLYLDNSTSYFDLATIVSPNATNTIIRYVFIEDTSGSNVVYNVYFDTAGLGFGSGNVTIEWIGSYQDAASGDIYTNYLYLNDNYSWGASTNVALTANGLPDNFAFNESPTKLIFQTPASPGFYAFLSGAVTNYYAFANAQLISTTEATNASPANPSGALTNLVGRIQIAAVGTNNQMSLNFAQITGPNYLSIQSPNQFNGSAGAEIISPFADMNVGVTNGFLVVSNLMQPMIPNWGGTVQAWTTRWLVPVTNYVGTNAVPGTNDYRVLIVGSRLTPITPAYVQDLILHGTNSLVLSDTFNVLRKLSVDAQSLTLTTNGPGNGATSVDGELNFENSAILWPSALPNLRWFTNNGALRIGNLAVFGSASARYGAFINNSLIMDYGSTIYADNFLNCGAISNGATGSFLLQSLTATLTNGYILAGGDISITADTLLASNVVLQAGRGLILQGTNLITDGFYLTSDYKPNTTNLNIWSVGKTNNTTFNGLFLPVKPLVGDLLGTTITNYAPAPNKLVTITWVGEDRGVSPSGYTNNAAVGHLILDALAANSTFKFTGVSASGTNALYVDWLDVRDQATNRGSGGSNFVAFTFNTNLVIYYARATAGSLDVAEKMNGKSTNHLRWVSNYVGYFSYTNFVFAGMTSPPVNISLAQSSSIDSDGDGVANAGDPIPFWFAVPGFDMFQLQVLTTNVPPETALVTWNTVPNGTNTVLYTTNFVTFQVLTSPVVVAKPAGSVITTISNSFVLTFTNGMRATPVSVTVADPWDQDTNRFYRVRLDLHQ